jgi:alpha-N-arabinofuranosidase
MATYGQWEQTVLEHTFDQVEYISLHTYLNNYAGDTAAFPACPDLMDTFIEEVVAIADSVAAKRRSSKRIMLSFDEWNVWYRTRRDRATRVKEGWPVAPPILEEIYTMEDALAFGGACISLLNHADRVKTACLAQLVNVIAPIMTEKGGAAWRQTIFWPFAQMSRFGRGHALRAKVDSPTYDATYYDPRGKQDNYYPIAAAPYLKLSAIADRGTKGLNLMMLNRHLTEPLSVEVMARGFSGKSVVAAMTLHDKDLQAVNSASAPDRVAPRKLGRISLDGERIKLTLPPASWSVVSLA